MIRSQILFEVYLKLPYEEILQHMIVCRQLNALLNDPVFWKRMAYRDFGAVAAELCDGDWREYYEICEKLDPASVHNTRFWGEKNKWGVVVCDIVSFFVKAMQQSNRRRLELYFRDGCNDVVHDEEYRRMLRWTYSHKKHKEYFGVWFEFLVQRIEFHSEEGWQHAANDLLANFIKDPCSTKVRPNIHDVIKLIRKSNKPPLPIIYDTLALSNDIGYYKIFSREFPQVRGCDVIHGPYCGAHLADWHFFRKIGKTANFTLLEQYLEMEGDDSDCGNVGEILGILLGCAKFDRVGFLRYLAERLPHIITPERVLWTCRLLNVPSSRILNFGLCCALQEGWSWDRIQNEIDVIMEGFLNIYRSLWENNLTRHKIEANISLLLDWGYKDYKKVIERTKSKTIIFVERLQPLLSGKSRRYLDLD